MKCDAFIECIVPSAVMTFVVPVLIQLSAGTADGTFSEKKTGSIGSKTMSSRMAKNRTRDGNPRSGSKLIAYECPSCHMLAWHENGSRENVSCPFCSSGLPTYITKNSPETMLPKDNSIRSKKNGGLPVNPARLRCRTPVVEAGQSPFELEFHTVQGAGFRCMAYRNSEGQWRGAFDNEELPGDIRVLD
jgi:hypothetical protein